ncbi:hypothetical protein GQ457_15G014950 [Hibiscus cannabinus]
MCTSHGCGEYALLIMNFAILDVYLTMMHDILRALPFGIKRKKTQLIELLKEYNNVCTHRVQISISYDLNNPHNFIIKISHYKQCRYLELYKHWGRKYNEILEMYKAYINLKFQWVNFTLEEKAKIAWLKNEFVMDEHSTIREVECTPQAYILVLIKGTLMPDKSSAMVVKESVVNDRLLNVDISGCMVLLQCWAWYRLPFLAPICPPPFEFPLATRVSSGSSSGAGSSSTRYDRRFGGTAGRRSRAVEKPEPEAQPQMLKVVEDFDVDSYPQGEGSFENVYVPKFHVSQPQYYEVQHYDIEYMTSVMATTSLSCPFFSTDVVVADVGGVGLNMFSTPGRMTLDYGDDTDDDESMEVSGGGDYDDDDEETPT